MESCCEDHGARIECLEETTTLLWDQVFGGNTDILAFAAGTGLYANADYPLGTAAINTLDADGVYLVGNISQDVVDESDSVTLGKNIEGFRSLFLQKKLWPVMGPQDWDLPTNGSLILDYFTYLPDAKRYYSVFYPDSMTEVYVLSTSRKSNGTRIYPTDEQLNESQYDWLSVRASNSPAKNKIVVFNDPFSTIKDTAVEDTDWWENFDLWDLEQWGIDLIVNGQTGLSFVLKRGYTHIVNPSSFITGASTPEQGGTVYGNQGWTIPYVSTDGAVVSADPAPKNQIFVVRASRSGLICQMVSSEAADTGHIDYQFTIPSRS